MIWKDVTSDYAGLFFRAEGGGSEAFGTLQNENFPSRYIDQVHYWQRLGWCSWCSLWHEISRN